MAVLAQRPGTASTPARAELYGRLRRLVGGVTGGRAWLPSEEDDLDLTTADELVELTLEFLTEKLQANPTPGLASKLVQSVASLHGIQREIHALCLTERLGALANVQEALARLRGIDSIAELSERATAELCRSCRFERAILVRVEDEELVVESTSGFGGIADSGAMGRVAPGVRVQLAADRPESEILRKRLAALVITPADGEGVFALASPRDHKVQYAAAPLMRHEQVTGMLIADCSITGRSLGTLERDALSVFAEGFNHAVERASLVARVRLQRGEIGGLVGRIQTAMRELCDMEVELSRADREAMRTIAPAATARFVAPRPPAEALLSRRELEVMELMISGATNHAIAERLFITHDTVKSHVGHILRKLRAANRVEAVTRFLAPADPSQGADGHPADPST